MYDFETIKEMCQSLGLVDEDGHVIVLITKTAIYKYGYNLFDGDYCLKPISNDIEFVNYCSQLLDSYEKKNNKQMVMKPNNK